MNINSDRPAPRKPAKSRTGLQNGREVATGSKRNVIQSSSFMDALGGGSTTEKEKKRPRMVNERKKRRSSEEDLLSGIYNKMNKMHETSSTIDYMQGGSSSGTHVDGPKSPPEVKTPTPISPPPPERVAKIRFADDHGRPLVDVRYFEVEEGERVNVNTLTHEQIRAMEVQMEKKALGKHGAAAKSEMKQEFSEDDPMEGYTMDAIGNSENKWRVIGLSNLPTRGYGTKSVEAKNETRRQQRALEAFYMPGRGVTRFEEPPLVDARATDRHRPKAIPLTCPVQQPATTIAAATPASTSSSQSTTTTPAATPNVVNVLKSDADAVPGIAGIATPATTAPTVPVTPLTALLPERSKVMDLLSKLKSNGILQGSPVAGQPTQPLQQQAAPPMVAPIYSQPAQPTYQQEFYLPPVTAASSTMPSMSSTISRPMVSNYHQPPANVYTRASATITQTAPTQHSYVATMPPQPITPHFSSQSAPALPVSATFNQMPIVVPPAPRNIEQAHYGGPGGGVGGGHFERPAIKPRGPFNGPVMGGYRQCRTYGTATGCSFGDRCRYAHGDQPPPAAAGVRRNAAKNEATIAGSVGARMGL
ncbi:unnamed protein product, partial [Mesorhabditis belari]|uniref:C3H1-type domain-containing protein n=1 Tax=Mesorhabditis belari TaxID=2138241 RepID=A0AAF3EDE7_9BILA